MTIRTSDDGLLTPPEGWSPQPLDAEVKPAVGMEVYLPDNRVIPIQDKLVKKYPVFLDWHTDVATVLQHPPFFGTLPDGRVGRSDEPIVQFVLVSDYPVTRPIQRKMGIRHGSTATVYLAAWEQAEYERKHAHYVRQGMDDPLELIFMALAARHHSEMMQLASVMN